MAHGQVDSVPIDDAGHWSFVGRDSDIAILVDLVATGTPGIVLEGEAGIGKSRLAQEFGYRWTAQGHRTMHLPCGAGIASVPYGIFAPLLTSDIIDAPNLDIALFQLIVGSEANPTLVIVDDANHADADSTALLEQLGLAPHTTIVATFRTTDLRGSISAIRSLPGFVTIELAPLSRADSRLLVEAILQGPADASLHDQLWGLGRGNALFIYEAIEAAQQREDLHLLKGEWQSTQPMEFSGRLTDMIEARLNKLGQAARTTLCLLSMAAEQLPAHLLDEVAPTGGVDQLIQAHLVHHYASGRRSFYAVSHPLYAEAQHKAMTPEERDHTVHMLLATQEKLPQVRRDDIVLVASWQQQLGYVTDAQVVADAANDALQALDLSVAASLARTALSADPASFSAKLVLAQVDCLLGQLEAGRTQLDALISSANTGANSSAALQARGMYEYLIGNDLASAGTYFRQAAAMVTEPAERDRLALMHALLLWTAGHHRESGNIARNIMRRGLVDPQLLLACAGIIAYAHAHIGQLAACHQVVADNQYLLDLVHRDAKERAILPTASAMAYSFASQWDQVSASLRIALDEAGERTPAAFVVAIRWLETEAFLLQGRVTEALAVTSPTLTLASDGFGHMVGIASHIRALVWSGRLVEARQALSDHQVDNSASAPTERSMLYATGWLLAAEGARTAGVNCFRRAAVLYRDVGMNYLAACCLFDIARLDSSSTVLPELQQLVEGSDPEWLPNLFVDAVIALQSGDPAAMAAQAAILDQRGVLPLAASMYGRAASTSTTNRTRYQHLATECVNRSGTVMPLTSYHPPSLLTQRETEIGLLAAHGFSSGEIADIIGSGVRNVDNHLRSIYQTLSIGGRTELTRTMLGGYEVIEPK